MVLCVAVCVSPCVLRAEIDYGSRVEGNEPRLYVDRYGMGEPMVVSNGYLFVEFGYIPPPYHIQRVGQGVVANGVLANCLFRGNPPIGETMRVNGMTESILKGTSQAFAERLVGFLDMNNAVFLYKNGYQNRYPSMPISESQMSLRVPIFDSVEEGFPHLLNDAITNQVPEVAINAIMRKAFRQGLTTNHIQTIIENVRQDTQLLARVQAELGIAPEPPNTGGE